MAQGNSPSPQSAADKGILSREALPVFVIFFMWGFGTGALWVVRPLFAYQLSGDSIFLVGIVSAASAAPRIFIGPITGYLSDRWGRRPLIMMGAIGHALILVGQFFSQDYLQFFLLEILAGVSIAFWNVSSNVLVADITKVSNRGRGVAVRNISQRSGQLAGPLMGGLIAAFMELRYVFLFIAATKLVVLFITIFLVRETKPEREKAKPAEPETSATQSQPAGSPATPKRQRIDLAMFRSRSFVALVAATLAYGMIGVGPGVFRTFFPVHAELNAGLGATEIGSLVSIAGFATLAITLPVGLLMDLRGRKLMLFMGMAFTAVSAFVMAGTGAFPMALVAVIVFGIGEGINTSAIQTYAMDLAPPDKRGMFLGIWHVSMNIGQFAGPLGIGLVANYFGMAAGFTVMAGIVTAAAVIVLVFAKETRQRRQSTAAPG
ncbi:MAG: MFS transporter [Dehalococcoidia bacterium]